MKILSTGSYALDVSRIPEHMRDAVTDYVFKGKLSGGFLTAVLENKLVEAFGRADLENQKAMGEWATFLYNEMPVDAWGSEAKVTAWAKHRGLEGQKL